MSSDDRALDRLLLLDGEIMEVGDGYWVNIKARLAPATAARPHGIKYSLCLFAPNDDRVVCFDNSHQILVSKGRAKKKTTTSNHVHEEEKLKPYDYTDAETLMVDFWEAVDHHLKKEGVQ